MKFLVHVSAVVYDSSGNHFELGCFERSREKTILTVIESAFCSLMTGAASSVLYSPLELATFISL